MTFFENMVVGLLSSIIAMLFFIYAAVLRIEAQTEVKKEAKK